MESLQNRKLSKTIFTTLINVLWMCLLGGLLSCQKKPEDEFSSIWGDYEIYKVIDYSIDPDDPKNADLISENKNLIGKHIIIEESLFSHPLEGLMRNPQYRVDRYQIVLKDGEKYKVITALHVTPCDGERSLASLEENSRRNIRAYDVKMSLPGIISVESGSLRLLAEKKKQDETVEVPTKHAGDEFSAVWGVYEIHEIVDEPAVAQHDSEYAGLVGQCMIIKKNLFFHPRHGTLHNPQYKLDRYEVIRTEGNVDKFITEDFYGYVYDERMEIVSLGVFDSRGDPFCNVEILTPDTISVGYYSGHLLAKRKK